jgi:signal recognition particle receptor subunit beta
VSSLGAEGRVVTSRIVIFGAAGAGTTTVLETMWRRLKPDQRGQVVRQTLSTDPSVTYEVLPVDLGEVNGLHRRLQLASVPRGAANSGPRRQLLKGVDGVIFVLDSALDRQADAGRAMQELADHLASYGRSLAEVPLVIVPNKRDQPGAVPSEEILRPLLQRLGGRRPPVFEAVATDGRGVLQALSAVAKLVISAGAAGGSPGPRSLGGPARVPVRADAADPRPTATGPSPPGPRRRSPPGPAGARPAPSLDGPPRAVCSVGTPHVVGGAILIPLVVRDDQGREQHLTLRLRIELSPGDGSGERGDA